MSADGCVTVVTGAGGFLGGAVLRALGRPAGPGRVVGCVRGAASGLDWPPGVERVVADLAAADGAARLRAALGPGPVRLVLLAGGDRAGFGANVDATLAALEAAAGRVRHVVYASSVAVYGSHRPHRLDGRDGRPQVAPDTCYGWSKWLAERALGLFARDGGTPVAVLRLSSLYGPGNQGGNAVAALTRAVAEHRPFVITAASADGALYARDYLWVDDAARAVAAASRSGFDGELDVGSGHLASPRDLAELVHAAGHRVMVEDRAAGSPVLRFGCDPGPAREALGVAPPRELAEGIADELAWRVSEAAG